MGDFWIMGEVLNYGWLWITGGGTDRQADIQTLINTMTCPGLGAGPSENGFRVLQFQRYNLWPDVSSQPGSRSQPMEQTHTHTNRHRDKIGDSVKTNISLCTTPSLHCPAYIVVLSAWEVTTTDCWTVLPSPAVTDYYHSTHTSRYTTIRRAFWVRLWMKKLQNSTRAKFQLPWIGAYYNGPKFKCQPTSGTGWFSYKIWTKKSKTPMVNLLKNLRPFQTYVFFFKYNGKSIF